MREILTRVHEEWKNHEYCAAAVLSEAILYPVFRARANRLQLTEATTGFNDPVLPDFTHLIFGFFRNFHEANLSFLPLTRIPAQAKVFVWLTNRTAKSESPVDIASGPFAPNRLLTNPEVLTSPFRADPTFLLKPFKTIAKVLVAKAPLENKEITNTLMGTFYKLIFARKDPGSVQPEGAAALRSCPAFSTTS